MNKINIKIGSCLEQSFIACLEDCSFIAQETMLKQCWHGSFLATHYCHGPEFGPAITSYCPYTFQQFFTIGPSHTSETILSHSGKIFNSEDDLHNLPLISQLREDLMPAYNCSAFKNICYGSSNSLQNSLNRSSVIKISIQVLPFLPYPKGLNVNVLFPRTLLKSVNLQLNDLYFFFLQNFLFFIIQWNTCSFTYICCILKLHY